MKKPRKKRGRGNYLEIYNLGLRIAEDQGLLVNLPSISIPDTMKLGVLDRAIDSATGKIKIRVKEDGTEVDKFGSIYRKTWDAQDELFPTAAARNFIEGLVEKGGSNAVAPATWQRWAKILDAISSLRIPTRFSGFSVAGELMQHPTQANEGYFSNEKVSSNHGRYDVDRVKYIARAILSAKAAGRDLQTQLFEGMRAAIEFTLNYFTAPVTASNVKPFSTKSGLESGDPAMQAQLQARERIKEIYVSLGGNLRNLPAGVSETPEQSWERPWRQGLAAPKGRSFAVAPPSPRRQRRSDSKAPAAVPVPVPVSGPPKLSSPPVPLSSPPKLSSPPVPAALQSHSSGSRYASPFATQSAPISPPLGLNFSFLARPIQSGPFVTSFAPSSPLLTTPNLYPIQNPIAFNPIPAMGIAGPLSGMLFRAPTLADDFVQGMTDAASEFLRSVRPGSDLGSISIPDGMPVSNGIELSDPVAFNFSFLQENASSPPIEPGEGDAEFDLERLLGPDDQLVIERLLGSLTNNDWFDDDWINLDLPDDLSMISPSTPASRAATTTSQVPQNPPQMTMEEQKDEMEEEDDLDISESRAFSWADQTEDMSTDDFASSFDEDDIAGRIIGLQCPPVPKGELVGATDASVAEVAILL